MLQALEAAVVEGVIVPALAATLKGRLQYTRAQTFGRAGAPGLQALRCYEAGRPWGAGEVADVADFWRRHFAARRPRRVRFKEQLPPVLIFTDGAVETIGCRLCVTVGGVLFDPWTKATPVYFAEEVSASRVDRWLAAGTKHPVFQAELLPVAMAAESWAHLTRDRDVILFLDNEAARYSLVRGYSPVLTAAKVIGEAWLSFAGCGAAVWFARVPTESNPADAPSRGQECPGWQRIRPKVPRGLGCASEWCKAG